MRVGDRARVAHVAAVLLGGAVAAASAAAVISVARGGPPGVPLAVAVAGPILVALVALRSAVAARRIADALEGERDRALGALAASEGRRAEAEPLAAAGARASAAAHDMASPIAALCANLDWLDEELGAGRLTARDPEVQAVVGDARAAAEALVRALSEVRRAADDAKRALRAAERAGAPPAGPSAGGSGSGE